MKKRLIPRGMKIFMTILLIIGIGSYIGAGVTLYKSGYQLANYYDEIEDMVYWDGVNFNNANKVTTRVELLTQENKAINISTDKSNIDLIGYEGNELKIELYGNFKKQESMDQYIQIKNELGVIQVSIAREDLSKDALLRVYIPNSYKNDVTLYSNSGGVNAGNIDLNTLTIRTEQREINLRNTKSNNVILETKYSGIYTEGISFSNSKISSTSGDVELNGMVGEGNIYTKSGDIDMDLNSLGKMLDIKSDSGNIELDMNLGLSYTVEYSSNSGIMECYDRDYINSSNQLKSFTQGNGENKINVTTKTGNLNIN